MRVCPKLFEPLWYVLSYYVKSFTISSKFIMLTSYYRQRAASLLCVCV